MLARAHTHTHTLRLPLLLKAVCGCIPPFDVVLPPVPNRAMWENDDTAEKEGGGDLLSNKRNKTDLKSQSQKYLLLCQAGERNSSFCDGEKPGSASNWCLGDQARASQESHRLV